MASFVFNVFKKSCMDGGIDLTTDTIKCMLVMTNCDIVDGSDADKDLLTMSAITCDQFDGSGYTSAGDTLGTKTVTQDNTDNESVFDAADVAFGALGAGTRAIAGAIIYKYSGAGNGEGATDIPYAFLDLASDYTADGSDVTLVFNAEGIINIT